MCAATTAPLGWPKPPSEIAGGLKQKPSTGVVQNALAAKASPAVDFQLHKSGVELQLEG